MNIEVSKEELELLKMLLSREEVGVRVEIHHATRSFEFRDYLKQREKVISDLLTRVKQLSPE